MADLQPYYDLIKAGRHLVLKVLYEMIGTFFVFMLHNMGILNIFGYRSESLVIIVSPGLLYWKFSQSNPPYFLVPQPTDPGFFVH